MPGTLSAEGRKYVYEDLVSIIGKCPRKEGAVARSGFAQKMHEPKCLRT